MEVQHILSHLDIGFSDVKYWNIAPVVGPVLLWQFSGAPLFKLCLSRIPLTSSERLS